MRTAGGAMLLLVLFVAGTPAAADENQDLELIPGGARQQPSPEPAAAAPGNGAQRIYFENAVTLSSLRNSLLVPFPPPGPPAWQQRPFLDLRRQWSLAPELSLALSDRFNLRAENDISTPSDENVLNEFREGYLSWEPVPQAYLDSGRINLKSGVGVGYNPTDFFKTRAVVEPLSADPTVLREDRLGTAMLRAQRVWSGGSVTAAYAPMLSAPSPLLRNTTLPAVNPLFGLTNANNRFLLKGISTLPKASAPNCCSIMAAAAPRSAPISPPASARRSSAMPNGRAATKQA